MSEYIFSLAFFITMSTFIIASIIYLNYHLRRDEYELP